MAATRRLQKVKFIFAFFEKSSSNLIIVFFFKLKYNLKELQDIQSSNIKSFRDIQVDEQNMLNWQGLIVPVSI